MVYGSIQRTILDHWIYLLSGLHTRLLKISKFNDPDSIGLCPEKERKKAASRPSLGVLRERERESPCVNELLVEIILRS